MKNKQREKQFKAQQRQRRVRQKFFGTAKRPRLSVFRSAKHFYLQLIDDARGVTMASAKDTEVKKKDKPQIIAKEVGKLLAQKAQAKGITQVVFDRGRYKYHGRVKAAADGAREAGLEF